VAHRFKAIKAIVVDTAYPAYTPTTVEIRHTASVKYEAHMIKKESAWSCDECYLVTALTLWKVVHVLTYAHS
jgi:hypothetical protein